MAVFLIFCFMKILFPSEMLMLPSKMKWVLGNDFEKVIEKTSPE